MPDLVLELPDVELLCIQVRQTNIAKCPEHTSVLVHKIFLLSWHTHCFIDKRASQQLSFGLQQPGQSAQVRVRVTYVKICLHVHAIRMPFQVLGLCLRARQTGPWSFWNHWAAHLHHRSVPCLLWQRAMVPYIQSTGNIRATHF